ncbi:MAG: beta-CASP ribonuclease aCPSF1 [Candidatus Nanoarchaeia archaeon]|nr:beta-CASP ribonuclease aCPSF1 [Candidatus Nanoarchaeia archaeon]
MVSEIIKVILSKLPEDIVSAASFEGANIVLYTKSRDYYINHRDDIKKIVKEIKKRIELRPDPSISEEQEKTKKYIEELIDKEAELSLIRFDPQRSIVRIECKKPGVAIGKNGANLNLIRDKTFWIPEIKRSAAIKSTIIDNIREVLYQNNDFRRNFLNNVGERIYNGWTRTKREEWVRLSFLGGGNQVGRSSILLQTPESRILLDFGIDVSSENSMYPLMDSPDFDVGELDAVIISHAHVDHTGAIPLLYKYGYRGPIYCTEPTRDIMSLLQLDVVKIAKMSGKDYPYNSDDIKEMVKHCITLNYEEVTDVTPDVRITLYNSGHILGSAMVHIHIGNGLHNFLYTGDLKFKNTKLLQRANYIFPRLESVLMESTYGGPNDIMPPLSVGDAELLDKVTEIAQSGGKILFPVLGSGRGQEIMMMLEQLMREGSIPKVDIYLDGMVWDICAIYTAYPEYLSSSIKSLIFNKGENPFLSDIFKRVGSNQEREELMNKDGPFIVLATSGMLTGGPSVEYFKRFADDSRNKIIFNCYQAPNSLGARISKGEKEFTFKSGDETKFIEVKMEVGSVRVSNHADRRELLSFVNHMKPRPKTIILNHGDPIKISNLANAISKMKFKVKVPKNLESIRLV